MNITKTQQYAEFLKELKDRIREAQISALKAINKQLDEKLQTVSAQNTFDFQKSLKTSFLVLNRLQYFLVKSNNSYFGRFRTSSCICSGLSGIRVTIEPARGR
jgi:gamma-glutamyl phosphate reductase